MYEKLVSRKLSIFCEKYIFLPVAQFVYRKCLGCTDALLTISHHLQKSLDAGMESYIVQLDFSAAFDRVRHNGLLFKLESIGIGAVFCPFIEFLSDRGGWMCCEWVDPNRFRCATGKCVGPLPFIIYTSEMFELVENRPFTCADDSTLLAVVQ